MLLKRRNTKQGFTIFIPNAINKGETVKILIVKVCKIHVGKIIKIIKADKSRIESDCATYKRCGGSIEHC